jgi:catechol 2,3-dioxygenase-like lactoylglutathione lyase family enzyme
MIVRVHHVQTTIPSGGEGVAREFYCGILGLTEIKKPLELQKRGGLWLQVGDTQLHLGIDDAPNRSLLRAHVAFELRNLESFRKRLENASVSILDSVPIPDYVRFEVRDPFGNRIEFIQPTP